MNYKVVIDPGHGGEDPGASGNGIVEKDLTLMISNYMKKRFDDLGIDNAINRTTDVTLNPDDRVKKTLSHFGNGANVIVLSNHINAGGGEGAEVIYALRNSDVLPRMIGTELEKEGQTIRKYYQRRLPSDPSKDYYYMIRNTPNTQAMLIEYGFLDNTADANKLKNNWEEYAEAVVRAVASYVGVPYVGIGGAGEYYTVEKGDSLWSIARKFNTTVDKLKELNNLSSNLLSVGQTLKISDDIEPMAEGYYIVKKGDTLYSIARTYGLSVARLKELNNLTSNNLSIGQSLIVLDTPTTQSDDNYYIVVSGDTLYGIANKFNTSVDKIKQANNLTSNNLAIGQELIIPGDNDYQVYTVVSGDTLYGIARKFNTTVSAIESLNNLTTSTLSIGQKLLIP